MILLILHCMKAKQLKKNKISQGKDTLKQKV